MSKPVIISREKLFEVLFNHQIPIETMERGITGKRFALPSRRWVFEVFAPYWSKVRSKYYPKGYKRGVNVCHHYAHGCAWHAGRCYEQTLGAPSDAYLCFGELWYWLKPDPGPEDEHAIAFTMVYEKEQHHVLSFEPQTSTQTPVTGVEPLWYLSKFVRV